MPRRGSLTRRSATEWGIRGLLAVIIAVLGYASVSRSLAAVLQNDNPEQALRLAPRDGRVLATFSRTLIGMNATADERARASGVARRALSEDPTAIGALTTLGLDAQLAGNISIARRLFIYSEHLSRRDIPTQLWEIEDAVSRGDIDTALTHYDTALRVSHTAPDLLFPVLASAISDPAIRLATVRTLARRPEWTNNFITYISGKGADPRSTAILFRELRRAGVPIAGESAIALINLLISHGAVDDAWSFYASTHPGVERNRSRDPHFDAGVFGLSPFDWRSADQASISASVQHGDMGNLLDFSAPSSVEGAVLQQLQLLPAGLYRLAGHSIGVDQPEVSRPYWTLTCPDGHELGHVDVTNSNENHGNFEGDLSVPATCPVQTLTLMVRPSEAVSGVTGQIDRVQLVPLHS